MITQRERDHIGAWSSLGTAIGGGLGYLVVTYVFHECADLGLFLGLALYNGWRIWRTR